MIDTISLLEIIIELVPQYIKIVEQNNINKINIVKITLKSKDFYILSLRPNTSELEKWINRLEKISNEFFELNLESFFTKKEIIRTRMVIEWLKIKNYQGDWFKLFDYCKQLDKRTYENSSIGFTFIYNFDITGTLDLVEFENQKLLDVLADSHYTFFEVDKTWAYIDYNFVELKNIPEQTDFPLLPSFLIPYQAILSDKQCGITRTKKGDLIIYDKLGLLASNRKGIWKIYESYSLRNVFIDIVGNHDLGANLFQILFDLSYKRHGALIILGNKDQSKSFVTNSSECFIDGNNILYKALNNRISKINIKNKDNLSKPLILELASMDGSILFDKNTGNLLAFGAMINHNKHANTESGARSTASLSAYHHGLIPFKISSDGEITAYIKDSKNNNLIRLNFL